MWDEHIPQSHQNGSALISKHGVNTSIMSERITDSSLPFGGNLDLENTKLLLEVLKLHSGHFYHRITSGLITSKDNLRASPRPITSEDNLHDCLHLSNLRASPGFMLGQPVSPAMLELPLSRDLNLHHKLELHCSSLHHTKMQVRSIKSNSSFQKKHTTSQIASANILCLGCTQCHAGLHPAKPRAHT